VLFIKQVLQPGLWDRVGMLGWQVLHRYLDVVQMHSNFSWLCIVFQTLLVLGEVERWWKTASEPTTTPSAGDPTTSNSEHDSVQTTDDPHSQALEIEHGLESPHDTSSWSICFIQFQAVMWTAFDVAGMVSLDWFRGYPTKTRMMVWAEKLSVLLTKKPRDVSLMPMLGYEWLSTLSNYLMFAVQLCVLLSMIRGRWRSAGLLSGAYFGTVFTARLVQGYLFKFPDTVASVYLLLPALCALCLVFGRRAETVVRERETKTTRVMEWFLTAVCVLQVVSLILFSSGLTVDHWTGEGYPAEADYERFNYKVCRSNWVVTHRAKQLSLSVWPDRHMPWREWKRIEDSPALLLQYAQDVQRMYSDFFQTDLVPIHFKMECSLNNRTAAMYAHGSATEGHLISLDDMVFHDFPQDNDEYYRELNMFQSNLEPGIIGRSVMFTYDTEFRLDGGWITGRTFRLRSAQAGRLSVPNKLTKILAYFPYCSEPEVLEVNRAQPVRYLYERLSFDLKVPYEILRIFTATQEMPFDDSSLWSLDDYGIFEGSSIFVHVVPHLRVNQKAQWEYPITLISVNHQKIYLWAGPDLPPAYIYRIIQVLCIPVQDVLLQVFTRSGVVLSNTFVAGVQDFGVVDGDVLSFQCAMETTKDTLAFAATFSPDVDTKSSCQATSEAQLPQRDLRWLEQNVTVLFQYEPDSTREQLEAANSKALRMRWHRDTGYVQEAPWHTDPYEPVSAIGTDSTTPMRLKRVETHEPGDPPVRMRMSNFQQPRALFSKFFNSTST